MNSIRSVVLTIQIKFYGREEQLEQLTKIYQDFCLGWASSSAVKAEISSSLETKVGNSSVTPIVLISGYSGSGKTALVEQFADQIETMARQDSTKSLINPCYFLSGKYDDVNGADPFSAIVAAFTDFVTNLRQGDNQELERIKSSILDAVGDEVTILIHMVPSLGSLIGKQTSSYANYHSNQEYAANGLRYVFSRFAQAIVDDHHPVVLFLDDLQWADEASLDLLADLATDIFL